MVNLFILLLAFLPPPDVSLVLVLLMSLLLLHLAELRKHEPFHLLLLFDLLQFMDTLKDLLLFSLL
jgi:hypothetical protein